MQPTLVNSLFHRCKTKHLKATQLEKYYNYQNAGEILTQQVFVVCNSDTNPDEQLYFAPHHNMY